MDSWSSMAGYSGLSTLPKQYKNCKMPEIFGKRESSSRKAKKFKVSASDMLTIYNVLRHWPIFIGMHWCRTSCEAWLAMCDVLDLLLCTMYGHPINPNQLDRFVEIALQKGVEAGWETSYIKKFHWMLHLETATGTILH